jgi:hypothetical protein
VAWSLHRSEHARCGSDKRDRELRNMGTNVVTQ